VLGRKSSARSRRAAFAKDALNYKPVRWTGKQAVIMMRGFREVVHHWKFKVHACSIMPTHVHMVIGRTGRNIRLVMNQLKGRASAALATEKLHPFQHVLDYRGSRVSCWTAKGWSVYLDSQHDMRRAIRYVENNPMKEGKKKQVWSIVESYPA
jgi:REP element-mobilizing transposase RayT